MRVAASTALDKKSAKKYKARMLERLGAKADKGPRTAASIGKGMARVGAKREAKALEEAIEAGMVQRKGLGKKKRAEKGETLVWLLAVLAHRTRAPERVVLVSCLVTVRGMQERIEGAALYVQAVVLVFARLPCYTRVR